MDVKVLKRVKFLEEYITRGKFDDRYAPFVIEGEKSKLLPALSEAEESLYTEEGEDATKSVYVARLDALKVLGDPITFRYRESEDRQKAVSQLRETLNTYLSQATSADEKYSHIDEKGKESVVEKVTVVDKWLNDMVAKQAERPKNVDPVFASAEALKKRDEVIFFATPILTRPKPKPPVLPTGTPTGGSGTGTPKPQTPQPDADKQQKQEPPAQEKKEGASSMDVD